MGVISFTAEAYARMQKAFLPSGRLWSLAPDSLLSLAFLAAGDELARVSGRSGDMVEEADSSTTTELLEDFEREMILPSTGTDAERRLRITALETARPWFRPIDVQQSLAPYLALDYTDVDVIETSRASAIAMADDNEVYRFHVYRDPLLSGTPDIAAAQVELDRISQSHTKGHVIESNDALFDDPYTLHDRDIYGA